MKRELQLLTARSLILATFLITICGVGLGQKPDHPETEDWKVYSSNEGRFWVTFPGTPTVTSDLLKSPGGDMVMVKHFVASRSTFGVIYLDYPTNFKDNFARKEFLNKAEKTTDAHLQENVETYIHGHPARRMKVISEGSVVHTNLILVGQRLYKIAVISAPLSTMKPEDVDVFNKSAGSFLNSFRLASQEPTGEVDKWFLANVGRESVLGTCSYSDCRAAEKGTISPGGRALKLGKPNYPALARFSRASGTVTVAVIINQEGRVIAAQPIEGNPLFNEAAVEAARKSQFTQTLYKGQPVNTSGNITYTFVAQ